MATTAPRRPDNDSTHRDRPGWIPSWVGDDWDPDPYAYQNEGDQMPVSIIHSIYTMLLSQMLAPLVADLGLYLLNDVFMLYRNRLGRKQRIAPDILIVPIRIELDARRLPRSYDMDMHPPPLCVIELTSAESHAKDQNDNPALYARFGILEYLVLDIVDPNGEPRDRVGISLQRLAGETYITVAPDDEGYVTLQTLGARLRMEHRHPVIEVLATGELLRTSVELAEALRQSEAIRIAAEQRADVEASARRQAEEELARVYAELEQLRGDRST